MRRMFVGRLLIIVGEQCFVFKPRDIDFFSNRARVFYRSEGSK